MINQFSGLDQGDKEGGPRLVTFSAGNYGKAFSYLCKQKNMSGRVLMPDTAAESRAQYIRVSPNKIYNYDLWVIIFAKNSRKELRSRSIRRRSF